MPLVQVSKWHAAAGLVSCTSAKLQDEMLSSVVVHHGIRQSHQQEEEDAQEGGVESTESKGDAALVALLGMPYAFAPATHDHKLEHKVELQVVQESPEDKHSRPTRPGAYPELLEELETEDDCLSPCHAGDGCDSEQMQSAGVRKDVTQNGVKQWIYTNWIKDEIEREEACLELPFTILLLVAFSVLTIRYINQETVTLVENSIVHDIEENANFAWAHNFGHKGIDDVNSFADFWSWCRLGLIPLLSPKDPWMYSEGLDQAVPVMPGRPAYDTSLLPTRWQMPFHRQPVPARNDYLRYNRIVGGFRLRQTVGMPSDALCKFPSGGETRLFIQWLGKPCTVTSRTDRYLPPDLFATERFSGQDRVEWFFPEREDYQTLIRRALDMEDGCTAARFYNRSCLCISCQGDPTDPSHPWLDELTLRVEISFILYNAQYGLYCVSVINFWFSRTGQIHKLINIRGSWAGLTVRDYGDLFFVLLSGVIWVFSILYVAQTEVKEIMALLRTKHKPWYLTITDHYVNFWNAVDWVSMTVASAITALFIILQMQTSTVNQDLAEIVLRAGDETQQEYAQQVQVFYNNVEEMTQSEWRFRFGCCVYPVILLMRVFKSFDAQPRLAVVTKTFMEAWGDLSHFAVVFLSVYLCMTVNAILFFGQDSIDFGTIDRAFHSCFMAMLGSWDWDEMKKIGLIRAFSWFFTFMLIMVMLLLNMLLAILMEAYSQVKEIAQNEPSLVHQIQNMVRRAQQNRRGERVRLVDIWTALYRLEGQDDEEMLRSDRLLYPQFLVESVAKIQFPQALRTLTTSKQAWDLLNQEPLSPGELRDTLERTEQRLDNMVLCSSWLSTKLQDYHDQSTIVALPPEEAEDEAGDLPSETGRQRQAPLRGSRHDSGSGEDQEQALLDAVEAVKQMVQDRTAELAQGVSSVLGEEMQSLGKRQTEQQRSMTDMRLRLSNLRRLIFKFRQTCEEITHLSGTLDRSAAARPRETNTPGVPETLWAPTQSQQALLRNSVRQRGRPSLRQTDVVSQAFAAPN